MTIVDLTKARAYAESLDDLSTADYGRAGADWIRELADEVESLQKLLTATRTTSQAALSEAAALAAENKELRDGLREICETVSTLIKSLP